MTSNTYADIIAFPRPRAVLPVVSAPGPRLPSKQIRITPATDYQAFTEAVIEVTKLRSRVMQLEEELMQAKEDLRVTREAMRAAD